MKNAYTDILKNNVKKSASLALICHWVFQQDTRLKNNIKLVQNFSGQHKTLGLLKAQIYTLELLRSPDNPFTVKLSVGKSDECFGGVSTNNVK